MEKNQNNAEIPKDFQIIFEKLDEAKKDHKILFDVNATGASLADSIKGIKEIVDSYSVIQHYSTITRI